MKKRTARTGLVVIVVLVAVAVSGVIVGTTTSIAVIEVKTYSHQGADLGALG